MFYVLLLSFLIGLLLCWAAWQKKAPKLRQIAQGLLVSYLTVALLLGIGEGYFRFVYTESMGFFTLSTVNWINRYYHKNSYGYRDREWQAEEFDDESVVMIIGDSFTAGAGIDDPANRYSDFLGEMLGDDYTVLNMGLPGTSTPNQLEALQTFPLAEPDIVIWQYFLNDIEYAALSEGSLAPLYVPPDIVKESYLLNFIYYRLAPPQNDYWLWLYGLYDNPVIWPKHQTEIEAMVDYVNGTDAELIVLIFPHMLDPVGSIAYIDRVAQVIEARGETDIIKLFDAVAGWPADVPLIAAPRDAHPSIEFNRFLAETLYNRYFQE